MLKALKKVIFNEMSRVNKRHNSKLHRTLATYMFIRIFMCYSWDYYNKAGGQICIHGPRMCNN